MVGFGWYDEVRGCDVDGVIGDLKREGVENELYWVKEYDRGIDSGMNIKRWVE